MISELQAELIAERLARTMAPPPRPRTLMEFAAAMTVRKKDRPVSVDLKRHPAQYYLTEAIDGAVRGRTRYRRIVNVKPTQDGGTIFGQSIPQLWCVGELGYPVVACLPDMRLAGLQWRTKTRLVMRDSGLNHWLPKEGPGSEEASTPIQIRLNDRGELYYMGGGASNEAGQALISGRVIFRDERDAISPYNAELMLGRGDHYGSDMVVIDTSTIKFDEESPTLDTYEMSTAGCVHFGCPNCWIFRQWRWSDVTADWRTSISAQDTVRIRCPNCTQTFDDVIRKRHMLRFENSRLVMRGQKVNAAGEIEGEPPETATWGLLWTALDSPLTELPDLAAKFWEAKKPGNDAQRRRFSRDRDCRPDVPEVTESEITNHSLSRQSARGQHHKRQVPAWARYLTIGQDVQGDRHYWLCLAHGENCDQMAVVDWGFEYLVERKDGQPQEQVTMAHRHAVLSKIDAMCQHGWQIEGTDERMVPVRLGIDEGYLKAEVVPWVLENRHWVLVKGVGRDQARKMDKTALQGRSLLPLALAAALLGLIDVRQPQTLPLPLANVNGHEMRLQLQKALMRQPGASGYCWLPRDLKSNDYLLLHLSAEVWCEELKDGIGTGKWYWREVRPNQNHLLDCATYAYALGVYHREVLRFQAQSPTKPTTAKPDRETTHENILHRRRHSRLR